MSVRKISGRKKGSTNEVLVNQGSQEGESEPPQEPPSKVGLHKSASISKFIPILILLLISFAVYFNALFGDFVYDDTQQILDNPWIRDMRNIPTIFSSSVWSFHPELIISNYYRPMMHLIYMRKHEKRSTSHFLT